MDFFEVRNLAQARKDQMPRGSLDISFYLFSTARKMDHLFYLLSIAQMKDDTIEVQIFN